MTLEPLFLLFEAGVDLFQLGLSLFELGSAFLEFLFLLLEPRGAFFQLGLPLLQLGDAFLECFVVIGQESVFIGQVLKSLAQGVRLVLERVYVADQLLLPSRQPQRVEPFAKELAELFEAPLYLGSNLGIDYSEVARGQTRR